eukprot:Gb_09439 [translate_table: standard]
MPFITENWPSKMIAKTSGKMVLLVMHTYHIHRAKVLLTILDSTQNNCVP